MKKILAHILPAIIVVTTIVSCTSENTGTPDDKRALVIVPSTANGTRAAVNYTAPDYFTLGNNEPDYSSASVSCNGANYNREAEYLYIGGVLEGVAGGSVLYYTLSPMDVSVKWPCQRVRDSFGQTVPKDQSTRIAFLSSDWLSKTVQGVTAADNLQVQLEHERSKVTFIAEGITGDITELQYNGYKAFCDPSTGFSCAQLMLDPVADIGVISPGVTGFAIIGGNLYEFAVTTVPQLTAGSNNTITISVIQ